MSAFGHDEPDLCACGQKIGHAASCLFVGGPEVSEIDRYRDAFAEITAKATPIEFDPADPERITAYRVPCGPIHRAAGKLGFQMFDGERHLAAAVARIRTLTVALEQITKCGRDDWQFRDGNPEPKWRLIAKDALE